MVKLYEKGGRWDALAEALEHVMQMFAKGYGLGALVLICFGHELVSL